MKVEFNVKNIQFESYLGAAVVITLRTRAADGKKSLTVGCLLPPLIRIEGSKNKV